MSDTIESLSARVRQLEGTLRYIRAQVRARRPSEAAAALKVVEMNCDAVLEDAATLAAIVGAAKGERQ